MGLFDNATNETLCGSGLVSLSEYYAKVHGYSSLIMCLVGAVGNVLNIIIFGRKEMITPAHIILQGLSTVDLIILLFYLPYCWYMFLRASTDLELYSYPWAVFLLYHSYLSQTLHCIGIWLTVVLSIWRYVAVAHPLRKEFWSSLTSTRRTVIAGYIICPILCAPILYSFRVREQYLPVNESGSIASDGNMTLLYTTTVLEPVDVWVNLNFILYSVFLRLLPSMLLTLLSVKLIFALMKSKRKRQHLTAKTAEREKQMDRITSMLLAVLILFLMNEIPQSVLVLLVFFYGMKVFSDCYARLGDILDMLALINSSLHFFLYYSISRQYRSSLDKIILGREPRRNRSILFVTNEETSLCTTRV